jgi:hypothetical protein
MPWGKFDDRYPWHRKIRPLSDAAFRLDVSAILWCSENLTNGVIAADQLTLVSDVKRPAKAAAELVKQVRWHEHGHTCDDCPAPPPGGWAVHDWLDFNPARAKVEEDREKRRAAGRQGGKASGRTRANAKQSGSDLPSTSEAPAASSPTNPRTRTPSPTTTAEGGSHVSDAHDDEPPRCSKHQGWDRDDVPDCWACGRKREQWETTRGADEVFQRPTWCGDCDQWTRQIETETGIARCPVCHPLAGQETA